MKKPLEYNQSLRVTIEILRLQNRYIEYAQERKGSVKGVIRWGIHPVQELMQVAVNGNQGAQRRSGLLIE